MAAAVVRGHVLKEAVAQLGSSVPLGTAELGGHTVGGHRCSQTGCVTRKPLDTQRLRAGCRRLGRTAGVRVWMRSVRAGVGRRGLQGSRSA